MNVETHRWVDKAESDMKGVRQLGGRRPQLNDLMCFHCQQAAEKYLKALLQEQGVPVPRTHDLGDLLDLLLPYDAALRPLRRGLVFLTQFAVDYRYPGENATKRQADSAIRWAERTRLAVRTRLGLRP
jgi:HEPN domain-containing protein